MDGLDWVVDGRQLVFRDKSILSLRWTIVLIVSDIGMTIAIINSVFIYGRYVNRDRKEGNGSQSRLKVGEKNVIQLLISRRREWLCCG